MNKLFLSAKKEILLIIRDVPGLLILFLMPVLLMTVVILAQEYTLNTQLGKTRLLYIDKSHSAFSEMLLDNINSSGFFLTDTLAFKEGSLKEETDGLIRESKYPVCLCIKYGDSVEIISDPALSGPYRANIINPLKYLVKAVQTRTVIQQMIRIPDGDMNALIDKTIEESVSRLPAARESFSGSEKAEIRPTAIQNIVPGFILFAMFFIVIPLAASIINEKHEGAFQRLRTLPVGFGVIIGSKVLIYFMVCLIQFVLMMLVGLWVFPHFFGLPRLEIGNNVPAILFATIASSLAAIGFGILVGSASGTMAQASLFGSVMVVMLGVISGTFLPVYVMPKAIQAISLLSPMRWGIDNYLDVFIRGGGILCLIRETYFSLLSLLSYSWSSFSFLRSDGGCAHGFRRHRHHGIPPPLPPRTKRSRHKLPSMAR